MSFMPLPWLLQPLTNSMSCYTDNSTSFLCLVQTINLISTIIYFTMYQFISINKFMSMVYKSMNKNLSPFNFIHMFIMNIISLYLIAFCIMILQESISIMYFPKLEDLPF